MLLTIAFVLFLAQVVAWVLLPASVQTEDTAVSLADMDGVEAAAA